MKKNKNPFMIIAIHLGIIIALLILFGNILLNLYEERQAMTMMTKLEAGINIGNDLDVKGIDSGAGELTIEEFESYWGNVPVTNKVFEAIASEGFKTVRIPVSWCEHLDSDGNVLPEWKERVHEVVDMALGQGLYVILDNHHEDFIIPTYEHEEEIKTKLAKLWEQIASEYASYDEHLLFEGMNEPRLKGTDEEWKGGTDEARDVINHLNQVFIDTVRKSGGNNKKRYLLIPAYASSSRTDALTALAIPDNDKHLMVSIHGYLPYHFTDSGKGNEIWEADNEKYTREIEELHKTVKNLFLDNHIPVIISEFGCEEKKSEEERLKWLEFYVKPLAEMGVPCVWWDNGDEYRMLDRENGSIFNQELVDKFLGFYKHNA